MSALDYENIITLFTGPRVACCKPALHIADGKAVWRIVSSGRKSFLVV